MEDRSFEIKYCHCKYDELDQTARKLINTAKEATNGSYSPYSGFSVGAAVLLQDGTVVTGSNQENASYPSGLCAERVALFSAGSAFPDKAVTAIAIAARTKGSFTNIPVTPCGACRQVIAEVASRYGCRIRIILFGTDYCLDFTDGATDLLPFSFGAEYL